MDTPQVVKKYSQYIPEDCQLSQQNEQNGKDSSKIPQFQDDNFFDKDMNEKEQVYLKTIENLQSSVQYLTQQLDAQTQNDQQKQSVIEDSDELIKKSQALLDEINKDNPQVLKQNDMVSNQLSRQVGILSSQVQNYKQEYSKSLYEMSVKNNQIEQLAGQVNMLTRTISNMQRAKKTDQDIVRQQYLRQLNEEREQWKLKLQQYESIIKQQEEKIDTFQSTMQQNNQTIQKLQNQVSQYQQILKEINTLSQDQQ